MMQQSQVAVIGGGSWGTALVKLLTTTQPAIYWYMRNSDNISHIKKYQHNPSYLSSVVLPTDRIHLTDNINEAVAHSHILFFAIPSAYLRAAVDKLHTGLSNRIVVSGIKGLVPDEHYTISEFFHRCHNVPCNQLVVVSGPTHSEEISMEKLSFVAVASSNEKWAHTVSNMLATRYLKPRPVDDVQGIEYAAVMKNIYALAAGIAKGAGFGDNYRAAFVSRAIEEIKCFLHEFVPVSRNINELQYLGDLLVTAYSQFSRNRIFGMMIGQGYSVKAARLEMKMIAEGYFAAKAIAPVAEAHHLQLPILQMAYSILFKNIPPAEALDTLNQQLNTY